MRDIVVHKFKGDRALERGLNAMAKKGYVVDQQASRKALYSATTGVFTRKQIHTVTFRKEGSAPPAKATAPAITKVKPAKMSREEHMAWLRDQITDPSASETLRKACEEKLAELERKGL